MFMYLADTPQASGGIKLIKQIYLCLYNFGAKWFSVTDTDHLLNTLEIIQIFNGPWREDLMWIENLLELQQGIWWHFCANLHPQSPQMFLHPAPKKPCYTPDKWTVLDYVQSTQYAKVPYNTPPLD